MIPRSRRGLARPTFDALEPRQMLDASTDTGAIVTGLTEQIIGGSATLKVSFSEPLDPASVSSLANYQIQTPGKNGVFRPASAGSLPITSATLDPSGLDITLGLARPLPSGTSVRVVIRGSLLGADHPRLHVRRDLLGQRQHLLAHRDHLRLAVCVLGDARADRGSLIGPITAETGVTSD
jgi:hypothetical protein